MKIRQAGKDDLAEILHLVTQAFQGDPHSDGSEGALVEKHWQSPYFIPQLALVAEEEGKLIGYLHFSKAWIEGKPVLALAPLAVLPAYQKQGAGKALMEYGHDQAKGLGFELVVVLGHETYYPRFGYQPAQDKGIQAPFEVLAVNYMVKSLVEAWPSYRGQVVYDGAFGIKP